MKRRLNNISPALLMLIVLLIVNTMRRGSADPSQMIYSKIIMLPGIIIGLSFHEFAHAFASDRLGDPLPRMQGRVTLNPAAHIDVFGFIALIFAGFGWGKPVQIDPRYYKNRRRDELIVSFAGVLMNFFVAVIFTLIAKIIISVNPAVIYSDLGEIIFEIIKDVIFINLVLMVFNLVPVPPLDGFGIITELFDLRKYSWYEMVYSNGYMILFALLIFNVIDIIMNPALNFFGNLMFKILVA